MTDGLFPQSVGFISHHHLDKSPQKTFAKEEGPFKIKLEGDNKNLCVYSKLTSQMPSLPAELVGKCTRLNIVAPHATPPCAELWCPMLFC